MQTKFNRSESFSNRDVTTRQSLSYLDKLLLVLNLLTVLIFLANLLLSDSLLPQWTIALDGVKISVIFIVNFIFIIYWLYRVRFFFFISMIGILCYCMFTGLQNGWEELRDSIVKIVMAPDESETQIIKDYIGNNKPHDHPRVWLTDDDIMMIRKGIASNPDLYKLNKTVIENSDLVISTDFAIHHEKGNQYIANVTEALRRLMFLSFTWKITKQKKYLNEAKEELKEACLVTDWLPIRYQYTAEVLLGVSFAYDCLYDQLTIDERTLVSRAIITKGIEPSLDSFYNSWLTESSVKNQIANAALICSAIIIYDSNENLAKKIINRSIASLKKSMTELYTPSGVYKAGYQSGIYGSTYNLLAIDALNKTFNNDFELSNSKGFSASGLYFQNMTTPSGASFDYSDGTYFFDLRLNPFMFWASKQLNDPSILWMTRFILSHGAYKDFFYNRFLPLVIKWGSNINYNEITAPSSNVFIERGTNAIALMRTSWSNNALYLGFKAGSPSNKEGHMDIGSFIIDANGKRWVTDLGGDNVNNLNDKGLNIYDMSQGSRRWDVFRNGTNSHSNLTVNNDKQKVDAFADIIKSSKNENFIFATSDLSAVYEGSLKSTKRGCAIIDKKYFQITDEVETLPTETSIRWKILTPAKVRILSKDLVELTQGGDDNKPIEKLYMKVIEPRNVNLQTYSTRPDYAYEARNTGITSVGFKVETNTPQKLRFTVLFGDKYEDMIKKYNTKALNAW